MIVRRTNLKWFTRILETILKLTLQREIGRYSETEVGFSLFGIKAMKVLLQEEGIAEWVKKYSTAEKT